MIGTGSVANGIVNLSCIHATTHSTTRIPIHSSLSLTSKPSVTNQFLKAASSTPMSNTLQVTLIKWTRYFTVRNATRRF